MCAWPADRIGLPGIRDSTFRPMPIGPLVGSLDVMVDVRQAGSAAGAWPMAASALGIGSLLLLDLAVGRTYFGINPPALVAGVAVGVCLLLAVRFLFPAALLAAATSFFITWAVYRIDPQVTRHALLGRHGWPGLAEGGGLLLLTCWSMRDLNPARAMAAVSWLFVAGIAIVRVRSQIRVGPVMTIVFTLGFAVAAGVGLYLRWLDSERRRDLDRVRQDERLAIARELHDVVAHYVTGIVVQAQAAQEVWTEQPGKAREALGHIEAAGAEALGSMRRLVGTLRGDDDEPLAPAATIDDLRSLAARSTAVGLPVRVHFDGVRELPPEMGPSIHRIVGEAITNAQRHATGATQVDVRLSAVGDELAVVVDDNGNATRAGRGGSAGYGLTGMAERTEALGGRFHAGPTDGGGWRVDARLPFRQAT
jgi:signal transduction histidine kinase